MDSIWTVEWRQKETTPKDRKRGRGLKRNLIEGMDRLVIGRKDNENGGSIGVNRWKASREREKEWGLSEREEREGGRVGVSMESGGRRGWRGIACCREHARMRCALVERGRRGRAYWYRWYALATVHSVNALPFSIRDVARTTVIARDA